MLAALVANVRWGAYWGFVSGCMYSLSQLGLRLVVGPEYFAQHDVTGQEIIPIYIMGLTLAGVIVGIARPLTRWLPGALVVGAIAAVPLMIGVCVAKYGPVNRWTGDQWSTAILSGVLFGIVVGWMAWWDSPYAGAPRKGRPDDKPSRKLFQHWKP